MAERSVAKGALSNPAFGPSFDEVRFERGEDGDGARVWHGERERPQPARCPEGKRACREIVAEEFAESLDSKRGNDLHPSPRLGRRGSLHPENCFRDWVVVSHTNSVLLRYLVRREAG